MALVETRRHWARTLNRDWPILPLGLLVAAFVAYPAIVGLRLLSSDSLARLSSHAALEPLYNSILLALFSAVPCALIGVPLAWLCAKSDMPARGTIAALVSISFVTPNLLISIAYVFLLGRNSGLFNVHWIEWFGAPLYDAYSFSGVVFVCVLHGYPLVFFTTLAGLSGLNPELEEAARVCGLRNWRVFLSITLGSVLPSILAGVLFCIAESLTTLAAPLVLGLPVGIHFMTTEIYSTIVMNPNMSAAAALSLPLVLATVTALWFRSWLLGGGGRRYMVMGGKGQRAERVRLGAWRWPAFILATIPLLLSLVLPIFALLSAALMDKWWRGFELGNLTLANFTYLFADSTTTAAIQNSLILSVGVGLVMALGGGAIAILIAGEQTTWKRIIRRLCELPLGVPHIVAGILIILAWYGPPFNLGGTLWLLAIGYVFLMLPYAVTTCEAARDQIDSSLADAASSSGLRPYQIWIHVLLPLMKSGLFTTFIIVFLFVIKEFSLTAMVYSAPTQTLAVRVFTFLDGGSYEKTASAAMLLLVITFAGLFIASKVFKISASDLRV